MKKRQLFFAFSFFLVAHSYSQSDKPLLTNNKLKTHLDSVVHKYVTIYMQDTSTNSIAIGIYDNGKKHMYSYGEVRRGGGRPITNDHFFNIGSVAKTFVTTMLAEAVVEKKAKLTDDIRKYLPGTYANLEFKETPISLINLANHTSGLPISFHTFSPSDIDRISKLDVTGKIMFYNSYNQDSLLSDLKQVKLKNVPGTKYEYNGNAMMLLMLLLERIYNQSYEKIVTRYFRRELRMYDTKTQLSESAIDNMIQGYSRANKPQQYTNFTGFIGGPSMNSTLRDMVKYLEANICEKNQAVKLTHKCTWGENDGFGVGLGWMMNTSASGERYIYHHGQTAIGFNTHCILYPKSKLGLVIVVNDLASQEKLDAIEKGIKIELTRPE